MYVYNYGVWDFIKKQHGHMTLHETEQGFIGVAILD